MDPDLRSADPRERLHAARSQGRRARKALDARGRGWPPGSPGALNAWLLLVTTKSPSWRDPLVDWVDSPPVSGEPHPNFFYPDSMGFWAEVRRWTTELLRLCAPDWGASEAMSVTAFLHLDDHPERLNLLLDACVPHVVLFLDEAAWSASGLDVEPVRYSIIDPYRSGQAYEGFWGRARDGTVVGKAPQHPRTHNLYRARDMDGFLRAAPVAVHA